MIILWSTTKNGTMHKISETKMDEIPGGAFLYMPNGKYLGRKPAAVTGNPYYSSEMIF